MGSISLVAQPYVPPLLAQRAGGKIPPGQVLRLLNFRMRPWREKGKVYVADVEMFPWLSPRFSSAIDRMDRSSFLRQIDPVASLPQGFFLVPLHLRFVAAIIRVR